MKYQIIKVKDGYIGLVFSERGLKKMYFNPKDRKRILAQLKSDFPLAEKTDNDWMGLNQRLIDYFSGIRVDFTDIQLDLHDFQDFTRKVYEIAQQIPYGEKWSYSRLAAESGSAKAARVAGRAMAYNPFMIVVPCHRVIKSDGTLGGWSGPKGWKTKLLKLEKS